MEILLNNNYICYKVLKGRKNQLIDDLALDAGNLMLLYPILLDQDYSKFDIKIYTDGSLMDFDTATAYFHSSHGSFPEFLLKIKKRNSPLCIC